MDTTTLTATSSAEAATATAAAAAEAASLSLASSTSPTLASNLQLCRICISSNVNCTQMISLFGEDSLWRKITTLADIKIERGDILPQQVCVTCAKNTISAYLFKKKCEDADSFYRQQLFLHKTVPQNNGADSEADDEFNNGSNIQHTNGQDDVSSHSYKHHNRPVNGCEGGDENEDDHELHPQIIAHQFKPDPEDDERRDNEEDDDEDSEEQQQLHIDESGEVKSLNNGLKPAFDFNSIRLMHEYMQQHLSKFNGLQGHHAPVASDEEAAGGDGTGSDSDQDDDDDGPLPLIPEIELITPSEICESGNNNGNAASVDGQAMTQMRGYQCPHCYQIFEMKQVLKAHMQSVHGAAGPVYECTNCKKTYFYKRFLEKHIRRGRCVKKRRNQTRPMQCSDCNVLFPTGHHLGWHKRTGCPSKTAKMPLQQLFKQNIVQYNNFPRRGSGRKPENTLYLHNRKLVMANNKRKGRTRIKLDARKIALAKQLILREATTTVIANELNISRTFAWRLRKSLVNGISLHERVIDPTEEEDDDAAANYNADEVVENVVQKAENLLNHHPFTEHFIKSENIASEDEEIDQGGQNDSEADFNQQRQQHEKQQYHQPQQPDDDEEDDDDHEYLQQMQLQQQQLKQHDNAVATSVIQRATTSASNEHMIAVQLQQQHQAIEQKLHNISVVQQQRLMELQPNNNTRTAHLEQQEDASPPGGSLNHNDASDEENQMTEDDYRLQQQQQQRETDLNTKCGVNSQEYTKNNSLKNVKSPLLNNGKLPLITQLSPAIAAAIHQLPVNLSIRPIASMQNSETSPSNNNNNTNSNRTPNGNSSKKKPRKPNVFIDDEKYAMAKMLVAQNASTMEIAKALNVSQMTAWKLRDAIIKGVPLSYRNKRDIRMTMVRPEEEASGSCGAASEGSEGKRETDSERQQQALLVKQQLEHQQKLQQQHIQQQQQIQQLLQRQQQLQQQQHQLEQAKLKQQREEEEEQRQLLVQQQQQLQQQQQQQRQQQLQSKQEQKQLNPRRRLKAAERELRDKEITREILELIREDNNIQYWKVSARLAEKGYAISPSSVCQKLKSMGIHRRWKPGDKPPLIDMEHLKANTNNSVTATTTSLNLSQAAHNSSLAAAALAANAAASSADESYEQQFDMGGAHFLSAFTR